MELVHLQITNVIIKLFIAKPIFVYHPPTPYERDIWYYHGADKGILQRSMKYFAWEQHLNQNSDPNWQVKEFAKIFLNLMSNFIPQEKKKIKPRDENA